MTCRLRLVVALFLGILAGVASAGSIPETQCFILSEESFVQL